MDLIGKVRAMSYSRRVFKFTKKIYVAPSHSDCALICDGMSIKSNHFYNNVTSSCDSFVNYVEGIALSDEGSIAKKAFVLLMLVSFKSHWKYPVGYILIDKVDAINNRNTLNRLLSRTLVLCASHYIRVRSTTMDATSTNKSAMKLFGCKFGNTLNKIDGSFSYNGYDYKLYFTPDPPHMLKHSL